MNNQLLLQGEASKYNSNSAVTRKMFTAVIFENFFSTNNLTKNTSITPIYPICRGNKPSSQG